MTQMSSVERRYYPAFLGLTRDWQRQRFCRMVIEIANQHLDAIWMVENFFFATSVVAIIHKLQVARPSKWQKVLWPGLKQYQSNQL